MPFTVTEYYYKTSDQSWNTTDHASASNSFVEAVTAWYLNTVQKQPGYISTNYTTDVDENTRKRSWVIDTFTNAKDFYNNTHNANDVFYANTLATANSLGYNSTFKIGLSITGDDGVEHWFISQPNKSANTANT
jgi:hypothetical protein